MNSKVSYFSMSSTLIRENIRRFWTVPVLGTVFYFLVIILPILVSYVDINDVAGYIELTLQGGNPLSIALNGLVPLVAGVMVFKYIHDQSSVTMMHAMPFTRGGLFNSNYLTGLLFSWIPVLTNGIILLVLSKPATHIVNMAYSAIGDGAGDSGAIVEKNMDVFARADIFDWIGQSLLVVTFVYAVVVFAAMITGNIVMHFLAGAGFNFLIPGAIGVIYIYCNEFLFGFDSGSGFFIDAMANSTPFIKTIAGSELFAITSEIGGLYIAGTIATMVLLYIISKILYNKRSLERASDVLVFPILEHFVCAIFTVLGVAFGGFYFQAAAGGDGLFVGFVMGGTVMFVVSRMIVKKAVRIFDKESLKSLGICALVGAIFVVTMVFDVTGYENRTPNVDKVTSVTLGNSGYQNKLFSGWVDTPVGSNYEIAETTYMERDFSFKTKENIGNIVALQKNIVANNVGGSSTYSQKENQNLYIDYDKGGKHQTRSYYNIDYSFIDGSSELKALYESKEYKDMFSIKNLGVKNIIGINMAGNRIFYDGKTGIYNSANIVIKDQTELKELIDCYEKDFRLRTFEEAISLEESYAKFYMEYTFEEGKKVRNGAATFTIGKDFENTIAWLEEKGYDEALREIPDNIEFVEITKYTCEFDEGYESTTTGGEGTKIIAKDKIEKVINGADLRPYTNLFYEIKVKVKPRGQYQLMDVAKAFVDSPKIVEVNYYATAGYTDSSAEYTLYLNEGNPLIEELLKK